MNRICSAYSTVSCPEVEGELAARLFYCTKFDTRNVHQVPTWKILPELHHRSFKYASYQTPTSMIRVCHLRDIGVGSGIGSRNVSELFLSVHA